MRFSICLMCWCVCFICLISTSLAGNSGFGRLSSRKVRDEQFVMNTANFLLLFFYGQA